jgi:hypothetical protein
MSEAALLIFKLVMLALDKSDDIAALIAKLKDHERTLAEAENSRKEARERLDGGK